LLALALACPASTGSSVSPASHALAMNRIVCLCCLIVSVIPAIGSAQSPLASAVQSIVDQRIAPGIVVLVADKDGTLATVTAGFASLAEKTPMRPDAVFWIASMSKSLTGTALMMLVDERRVSLDDPVEKYLPEFHGQLVEQADQSPHPPRHPITVREVMNHTSGMVLANDKSLTRMHSLKDDVAQAAARPLRQEPGTKYEYNNCGINTAGGSSKWSAACPTPSSCSNGCSIRWGCTTRLVGRTKNRRHASRTPRARPKISAI
jgi:CubicO group peptidase (beta-lactamase class C family)